MSSTSVRTASGQRVCERGAALPRPTIVLGLLCLLSAGLLIVLGTRLTFFNDDWYIILQRPGFESHGGLDTLLAPHNGNMVVLFVLIYKVLLAVFGMGSQLPFRLVAAAATVGLGILVYALTSERVGPIVGLVAAAIVLFLGPAWEALVFFGGANHLLALALGLAAFCLLETDTPRRNAIACVALVCGVSISATGLAMVAGAAIAVALRRRPRQLWIPVIPAAVFGAWWIAYGHTQSTGITSNHIAHLPGYAFAAFSDGLASITGSLSGHFTWITNGHLLAIAVIVLFLAWIWRGGRPGPWALVFGGALVAFWLLTGASAIQGRGAQASRYQLTDGTLLILLVAELARHARLRRPHVITICVIGVLIVGANLNVLRHGFNFMHRETGITKADLGALEMAGARAPSDFRFSAFVAQDPYMTGITAGRWFAETSDYGASAFDTPVELARASPQDRQAADSVLIAAYSPLSRATPGTAALPGCRAVALTAGSAVATVTVGTGPTEVENRSGKGLVIGLERFGPPRRPHYVGFIAPRTSVRVTLPADGAAQPWRIAVAKPGGSAATAAVCPGRVGAG
jgi:hypothetical protein